MTWHSLTENIIQIASTVMLLLFALEVTVRTAIITWGELQKAWRGLSEQ